MTSDLEQQWTQRMVSEILNQLQLGKVIETPLDLDVKYYGREGARQVLDAIIEHPNVITQLWYTNDASDDYDGKKLAEIIATNHTLTVLVIAGNPFSVEVAMEFANALRINHSLVYLNTPASFAIGQQEIFDTFKDAPRSDCPDSKWTLSKGIKTNFFKRFNQ